MGLFSSKKSVTNTSQFVDTDNISLADLDRSLALAGVENSTVKINFEQTDLGALDVAENIAIEGFDVIGDAFNENIELSRDVLNLADVSVERTANALAAGQAEAFGFGEQALGFAQSATVASLDFVDDLANRSFDVVSDIADTFVDFTAGQSTELRNAIGDIQARESSNTDARLGDITRVALIVAGVVAVVGVAAAVFKG